jgi:hypothetical protein
MKISIELDDKKTTQRVVSNGITYHISKIGGEYCACGCGLLTKGRSKYAKVMCVEQEHTEQEKG